VPLLPAHRARLHDDEMHAYDVKDLKRLFGLPASAVRALTRAGNIHPVRRAGKLHYTFQDLVVLRTASALRAANISSQRINRTLQKLRSALPAEASLNQLSLTALGSRIAIREGRTLRESESGQYALALEIVEEKGRLHVITRHNPAAPSAAAAAPAGSAATPATDQTADEWFEQALELEDTDPTQARAAYEATLQADPNHVEARINLGRLLHTQGLLPEAERIYRAAARAEPMLVFNLAVLLEDLGREPDAILAYRETLAMDPLFADAHFNLARLYQAKDPKASLRHLLAYRRMMDRPGS
jgi:tetratricopeptide (TPR) repeat protein